MELNDRTPIVQFIKYALVGVMNTLITLAIIFVCKSLLGINEYVSNALGYIGGLINSFLWNKNWVFKVKEDSVRQAVRFLLGFGICYALQFVAMYLLNEQYGSYVWLIFGFPISGYGIANCISMVLYTLANFVYNRLITFRI